MVQWRSRLLQCSPWCGSRESLIAGLYRIASTRLEGLDGARRWSKGYFRVLPPTCKIRVDSAKKAVVVRFSLFRCRKARRNFNRAATQFLTVSN
jgi:hypothetical protein